MSGNGKKSKTSQIIAIVISLLKLYSIILSLSKGYTKLDIPNYPINIDVPAISDGDDKIIVTDFSYVNTYDGKSHLCYEMNSNGTTNYYDIKERKIIDKNTIDMNHILKFEDEIRNQVPLDRKGLGDPKQLDQVVFVAMEEYGIKVIKKETGN